jgi:hypothetical protein
MITSLKERITELEVSLNEGSSKENDLLAKLNESREKVRDHKRTSLYIFFFFYLFISLTIGKIIHLEDERSKLNIDIEKLENRLMEIDRLKELEQLIQSQKWNELGQLAENMKSFSFRASHS